MIKEIVEKMLADSTPAGRLHKLTVYRNELNDMIDEFEKNWKWCQGCQDYINIEKKDENAVVELMYDFSPARHAVRCKKCKSVLMLLD